MIEATRPEGIPSRPGGPARGACGAVIATAGALATFVAIGMISWTAVRGYQGVGLCGALGAAAGLTMAGPGAKMARALGGAAGGVVAGFFALSAAELYPPATATWALAGGVFAALLALPVAAVVGAFVGRR